MNISPNITFVQSINRLSINSRLFWTPKMPRDVIIFPEKLSKTNRGPNIQLFINIEFDKLKHIKIQY